METFLMKALQLVVALVILVTIHEFGHYIFARIFGVKVNRFYLFFNPWFSLLKWHPDTGKLEVIAWTKKKAPDSDEEEEKSLFTFQVNKPHPDSHPDGRPNWRSTMFGLGWLPLGGYCDIDGMVDETTGADALSAEPKPWEFRTKPAWQRLLVMVAGVLFNFLLSIGIYAGIAMHWGDRVVPLQEAYEGMDFAEPLHEAGFQDGDIILTIDGKHADAKRNSLQWDLIQPGTRVELLRDHSDTVRLTVPDYLLEKVVALNSGIMGYRIPVFVDRLQPGMPAAKAGLEEGDRIIAVDSVATPSLGEFYAALDSHKGAEVPMTIVRDGSEIAVPVAINDGGKIGIQLRPADKIFPVEEVRYGFFGAFPRGWEIGTNQLSTYVSSLKLVFTREGAKQVGGFGAIGNMFPEKWNWYDFWQITAFLSVILAFMNFLPIPALDGGHILFLLCEIVSRRKLPDRFLEIANTIGFFFLLALLLFANGNDILRLFQ